jgi:hypothetical protein
MTVFLVLGLLLVWRFVLPAPIPTRLFLLIILPFLGIAIIWHLAMRKLVETREKLAKAEAELEALKAKGLPK